MLYSLGNLLNLIKIKVQTKRRTLFFDKDTNTCPIGQILVENYTILTKMDAFICFLLLNFGA
ncbi:hypothetical protein AGMMS4957_07220 [Bacteroidia bacterium]|nr:hypothetical protein AGMMS4957_07220 [Bacteroidia bacterium]